MTPQAVRRYPSAAIREARITTALRAAGYRIPDVQKTIESIRRLDVIARRTLALLSAGADITELITT